MFGSQSGGLSNQRNYDKEAEISMSEVTWQSSICVLKRKKVKNQDKHLSVLSNIDQTTR